MGRLICDLCLRGSPAWLYETAYPLDIMPGLVAEEFMACDTCKVLVEAGEWHELARMAVDGYLHSDVFDSIRQQMAEASPQLYEMFQEKIVGDAERLIEAFSHAKRGEPRPV